MKVGVVLPSYHDPNNEWRRVFLERFIPSLKYISEVDDLVFLLNCQGYSEDEAKEIRKSLDDSMINNQSWRYLIKFVPKYDNPSMTIIREDAMRLDPDLPIYMYIDDDFKFNPGSGEDYNNLLRLMESDESVGMVMASGFLGGYNYVGVLKKAIEKEWATSRGLFFRNLYLSNGSPINSQEALDNLVGGFEEKVVALETLASGKSLATYFNVHTTHKTTRMDGKGFEKEIKSHKPERYSKDQIHDTTSTFWSLNKYIKERFGIEVNIRKRTDFLPVLSLVSNKFKRMR